VNATVERGCKAFAAITRLNENAVETEPAERSSDFVVTVSAEVARSTEEAELADQVATAE
jgi:hypothetical protein